MKTLRFSVIIPTLNEEKFLPNLLTSLVIQTEKPFEVIVVDGKSKDETAAVAQSFQKKLPLRVIACERANVSAQRNLGAKEARGEWLVFVDADSVLMPYFFDRIDQCISTTHPKLFTTWILSDADASQNALYSLLGNIFLELAIALRRPLAPGPLTVVDRDTFIRVGGYAEGLTWGEDYDLTKRINEHGVPLLVLREALYRWSQRRIRHKGVLPFLKAYLKASLLILLTKKNFKHMPGYIMGGQLYGTKKK